MIPVKLPDSLMWYRNLVLDRLWPQTDGIPEDWKIWSQSLSAVFAACDIPEPSVPESVSTLVEKLFLLRFEALNELRKQIDSKIKEGSEQEKQLEDIGACFIKKYNRFSSKRVNIAIIDRIGLRVCPYCNENYIENRRLRRGALPNTEKVHSAAQLDHFFPKKHINYGIFSLTLANLVPVCPVCNHIKREQELKISPYMRARKLDDVKFTWESAKKEPIPTSAEDMLLILQANSPDNQIAKGILQDMETLHLAKGTKGNSSFYIPHKREVFFMLCEARKYSDTHMHQLWIDLGKELGYDSKQEMFKKQLGIFYSGEEVSNYSLGKLRLDIFCSTCQKFMQNAD